MKPYIFRILIVVVLVFLASRILLGRTGLIRQYRLQQHNEELQVSIDSLKVELLNKKEELERLRSDSSYMENIARTKLGMTKTGEKAFQFVESIDSLVK